MSKRTLTLLKLALLDIPIPLNPGLASAQMDSQHSSAVMNYQRVNDRAAYRWAPGLKMVPQHYAPRVCR